MKWMSKQNTPDEGRRANCTCLGYDGLLPILSELRGTDEHVGWFFSLSDAEYPPNFADLWRGWESWCGLSLPPSVLHLQEAQRRSPPVGELSLPSPLLLRRDPSREIKRPVNELSVPAPSVCVLLLFQMGPRTGACPQNTTRTRSCIFV